jgi:hypothetical protein
MFGSTQEQESPSFLFMDIRMPVTGGVETTKKMKDLVKNGEINYVLIIA